MHMTFDVFVAEVLDVCIVQFLSCVDMTSLWMLCLQVFDTVSDGSVCSRELVNQERLP